VTVRVLPVGDAALTVEYGDRIDLGLAARVRALDASLAREAFPGFREAVPTCRSLLVVFDPRETSRHEVGRILLARGENAASEESEGRLHRIPTKYGGEEGPDLAFVAREKGLSEAEVVALHSGRDYTALMLGFTPGFAYLGALPEELRLPRRATPRPRVAAGSVAIAAAQTAVYPSASPGGWHVLGRTSHRLFDPCADPPALVRPGDRVRFEPVDVLEEPSPLSAPDASESKAEKALEVVAGGLLTTVQDAGRHGYRRFGVAWAGPVDARSLAAANLAVGNLPGEAGLECTIAGPTLRFLRGTLFAIAGADLGAVLHRADLGPWPVPIGTRVLARADNVLAFTGRASGCRAYLAFAGGIRVPVVLGSRATDLAGGFGGVAGRALEAGALLSLGQARPAEGVRGGADSSFALEETTRLRVVLGPQSDNFTSEAVERLMSESYRLETTSDRTGCRLSGARLAHAGSAEIVSDGMLPGSIQVPADGQPIVMLADSPTTGGYAKIATVVASDLARLAQLLPGEGRVTFTVDRA
jgi:antagonist of KipI